MLPIMLRANPAVCSKVLGKKSASHTFRHATFSLSEASIRQLDDVAQSTGIAKSRLLRMFIHYYCDLSDDEQQALLTQVQDLPPSSEQ
nr:hypothetical protein [Shewanella dokdonensis]